MSVFLGQIGEDARQFVPGVCAEFDQDTCSGTGVIGHRLSVPSPDLRQGGRFGIDSVV